MAGKFFKIGSIFLLFAMKVDKGHAHRSRGKSPASGAYLLPNLASGADLVSYFYLMRDKQS